MPPSDDEDVEAF
ncbi:Protein of unknown function [Propionibacterium freudenreichii]|nr:Protein of unknown function [Propionibacterium freudenreichii]CEI26419.1 Protein of unknown function [Propionibacterium freudenreichii]